MEFAVQPVVLDVTVVAGMAQVEQPEIA